MRAGSWACRTVSLGVVQLLSCFRDLSDKANHFGIFLELRFDERGKLLIRWRVLVPRFPLCLP